MSAFNTEIAIPPVQAKPAHRESCIKETAASHAVVGILLDNNFDDWIKALGLPLQKFANHMMGSWVFNYIQALQKSGVKPVLFCVSSEVDAHTLLTHIPTGVTIHVFPPTRIFRLIRRWLPNRPSCQSWHGAPKGVLNRMQAGLVWFMNSYLSTPVITLFKTINREGCRSLLVQEYESVRFDICVIVGKLSRTPVMGTFTGGFPQANILRPLRSLALKLCKGLVICATREMSRVTSRYKLPRHKLLDLLYPLDFSVWYPGDKEQARSLLKIPKDAQIVIYHGETLLWTKGLDVLINAWERITRDRPDHDLRLILIGTGADADHLSRLLAARRLHGVRWLNEWVHDRGLVQRYLSAADAYIFPSRSDAFGISIIEAMACGLPVVASSVRGIPDIFPKREASGGLLVPPGDLEALVRAICRILGDRAFASELGRRARRHAEASFSMEIIGKRLSAFVLDGCQ